MQAQPWCKLTLNPALSIPWALAGYLYCCRQRYVIPEFCCCQMLQGVQPFPFLSIESSHLPCSTRDTNARRWGRHSTRPYAHTLTYASPCCSPFKRTHCVCGRGAHPTITSRFVIRRVMQSASRSGQQTAQHH